MWDVRAIACAVEAASGIKFTSDLTEALADPAVDCVIVSTPTDAHAPAIEASLVAGKHVFAEKPVRSISDNQ